MLKGEAAVLCSDRMSLFITVILVFTWLTALMALTKTKAETVDSVGWGLQCHSVGDGIAAQGTLRHVCKIFAKRATTQSQ